MAKCVDDERQSESDPSFWEVVDRGSRCACEKNLCCPSHLRRGHGWCLGGDISARGRGHDHLDCKPVQAGPPVIFTSYEMLRHFVIQSQDHPTLITQNRSQAKIHNHNYV
jgi:hypothetical protein